MTKPQFSPGPHDLQRLQDHALYISYETARIAKTLVGQEAKEAFIKLEDDLREALLLHEELARLHYDEDLLHKEEKKEI